MAPEGGDVFRFYEVEYSLACGMDGERDVAGIVKWAQDELGLTPSPHEVRTVIAALGDLGFIDTAEAAPELAVGVVAAEPAPAAPEDRASPGVELGAAGAEGLALELDAEPAPAPELALGAAGAAPRITRPTPAAGHEVALGAPGRAARPTPAPSGTSDVSIDLSDHIAVRPDDVKEAVRASRVMSAVDLPAEAPHAIQDPPTAPASAFDAPTVARIPNPAMLAESTPRPQFARSSDLPTADTIRVGKSPLRQPATPSRPPVELPPAPVTVKVDKPMPPPGPRPGVSPLLLVVLILVILGGGVFFAWKYVLERPGTEIDTSSAPAPTPVKPAPPPPPPPPPAVAKIALETPEADEVKVPRQGVLETLVTEPKPVKDGEPVAKIKGNKQLEAQLTAMTNDENRQKALLEAATKRFDAAHAAGNKAVEAAAQTEIAERHKIIDQKENARAAKQADYDTFLVRAPRAGTFTASVKLGANVAADTVIGKVQRDAIPVATFKLGNSRSFAANASVEIAIRKGEQRVTCTVSDVQADSVKVTCPVDPELTEGTEVALQTPSAATSAPPEAPPMPAAPGGTPGSAGAPPPGEPAGAPPAPGGAAAPGDPAAPAPSGSAAPAAGSDGK